VSIDVTSLVALDVHVHAERNRGEEEERRGGAEQRLEHDAA